MAVGTASAGHPLLPGAVGVACSAISAVRPNRLAAMLSVALLAVQFAWPPATPGLAPVYAAGFVILIELVAWSLEVASGDRPQPAWRLARIGLLAGGAVVLAAFALAVAAFPLRGGVLRAVGVGAGVALWTAVVLLARRRLQGR